MREQVRQHDCVARLGGDEFAILLQDCPLEEARNIANKLRLAIDDFNFAWAERQFKVTASLGVVGIDNTDTSVSDILREADTCCYRAKEKGRNRIQVYQPNDEATTRHQGEMHWVSKIHSGIKEKRFSLFIQETQCISRDGILLEMNPAGLEIVEADSIDEVRGACVYDLIAPEDRQRFIDFNERIFSGQSEKIEYHVIGLKGTRKSVESHAVPLRDSNNEIISHLATTRDITQSRQLAEKLSFQANHDMLTGLINRHEFERRVENTLLQHDSEHESHAVYF